jgi:putative FmdB family regulatory protein
MPIYEYQCKHCNHAFEQLQLQSDAPPQLCPKCGHNIEKLMSTGAFKMNHSGTHAPQATCCGQQTPCDSPKGCCGMGP